MITVPGNVRVWLATGHTDMRRGFRALALLVQETLKRDPHAGDLYVFRGRRGDLIKIIWHDGRRRDDQCCAARVSFVRNRLADAPRNLAATSGRVKRDELTHAAEPARFFAANLVESRLWQRPPIRSPQISPARMR